MVERLVSESSVDCVLYLWLMMGYVLSTMPVFVMMLLQRGSGLGGGEGLGLGLVSAFPEHVYRALLLLETHDETTTP